MLARLPRDVFDRLASDHPHSMLAVVRTFLDGRVDQQRRRGPSPTTITVVGVHPGMDVHGLTVRLARHLSRLAGTIHLWSGCVDEMLHRDGSANSLPDTPEGMRVRYWLDDAEIDHGVVVLEADPGWTPWTRRAVGQADHILILADTALADVSPGPLESELYETLRGSATPPRTTLVLLHPSAAETPRGTVRWLVRRPVTDHLHVRRDSDAHLGRLARIASGRAVSLVLGGGGARGFPILASSVQCGSCASRST